NTHALRAHFGLSDSLSFLQAEDVIRARNVTGVQTCALPIYIPRPRLCYPRPSGGTLAAHLLPVLRETRYRHRPDLLRQSGPQGRSEERRVGKEWRWRVWGSV